MSIFAGLGTVDSILRGANTLLAQMKSPRREASNGTSDFDQVLQGALAKGPGMSGEGPARLDAIARQADSLIVRSEQFVQLRDADGDGLLSEDESGLAEDVFERLDVNGDRRLSSAEVRRPSMELLDARRAVWTRDL